LKKIPVLKTLFRDSILEALPDPVRGRLEDVVGLKSMPHGVFRDYVVHAVEKYRQDELKLKEQDKNIQRKFAQLQLGELQGKQKVKGQALLTPWATELVLPTSTAMNLTPAVITQPPCPLQTPLPVQTPPVVNVYPQPSYTQRSGGQVQYRPRRGFRRGTPGGRRSMGVCWGCGKLGHFADRCPRAQGSPNIQHDRGQSLRGGATTTLIQL